MGSRGLCSLAGVEGAELPSSPSADGETPLPQGAPRGVNLKTVRWTVFKEGRPCKRGPPLVRRPHKATCERAASTFFITFQTETSFVSRSQLRISRKHRHPPYFGGFPVAPEPLRVICLPIPSGGHLPSQCGAVCNADYLRSRTEFARVLCTLLFLYVRAPDGAVGAAIICPHGFVK